MKAIISAALLIYLAVAYSEIISDLGCPIPDKENATLVPNPNNCNDYFACLAGEAIPMHCPKGLHFNRKLSVCDWPWRAGCEIRNK